MQNHRPWRRARSAVAGVLGLSMVAALATAGLTASAASASSAPVVSPGPAKYAKAAKTFYCGKTITLYIPFAPGGGTDQYGRAYSQQVQQFIPCHPTIVVKNLAGAGGLTAMQQVEQVLPADGMTMVIANSAIVLIVLVGQQAGSNFGLNAMDPVFDVASPTVFFVRSAIGTTLPAIKAYSLSHKINMSFTSPGSTGQASNYLGLMLLGVSHTSFNAVDGFTGLGAPVALAIQQGSIDASGDPPAGYTQSFLPLQTSGLLTPIFQSGTLDASGNIVPVPGWKPGGVKVPTIKALYQSLNKGKAPGGLLWTTMKVLVGDLFINAGEVFLTRTGTPPVALYALREGFDKLIQSKSTLATLASTIGSTQTGLVFNYLQATAALKTLTKLPTSVVHELGCTSGVYNSACLSGQP